MPMSLTASSFPQDGEIPARHTCEGHDISPELFWTDVPEGTKSLVLIVDDPDAPDPAAPQRVFVHWVLYNLPADTNALAEGAATLPAGAVQGRTDFGKARYGGPCPPIGRHRYFFKLYALDRELDAGKTLDKAGLEAAMQGHVLAKAELIGTYQKGDR